jgi:hypothetical protein
MSKESEGGEKAPKPISIRDVLGDRPPKRPSSGRASTGAAPVRPGGTSGQNSGRTPTPVRVGLAGPESAEPSAPPVVRTRRLSVGEIEWSVELLGIGRSGTRPDPGTPVLHLSFRNEALEGKDVREVMCAGGEDLSGMTDERLEELLKRSRPRREAS